MKLRLINIIISLQIFFSVHLFCQADQDVPVSPSLNLVTVTQPEGNVLLNWSPSPSPDVAGYVVYSFRDDAGFEPDTIKDPVCTSYVRHGTGPSYFSESFVVAALDSSGNISPLSNELHTVFASAKLDSCNKKIEITWNSYSSKPKQVIDYTILFSVNGGSSYEVAGIASPDKNDYIISDFITDALYCFIVKANLEGGFSSSSNKTCLPTRMQTPPQWINADYATISDANEISLAFTIDPLSEIGNYILERTNDTSGVFTQIAQFTSISGSLSYTDKTADIRKINYYRLSAKNNC
ncbi:MAG TPA: hypothetical protein PLR88_02735, partial [Bacteroidales bacterium]|nr:hypothetical protein [Bacteroidales bacterium]